jgi:hypothetical protein
LTGPIADFLQIKDALGVEVAIIIFLLIVICVLLFKHFKSKLALEDAKAHRVAETLELVRQSIELDSGQSVSLVTLATDLVDLTGKVDQNCEGCDEHRKDVAQLTADLVDLHADVHALITEGKERQVVISSIASRLDKLFGEVLATLRLGLGVKQKQQHEED